MIDAEGYRAVVYVLQHEYEAASGSDEVKLIGVYRSRERAEAAAERLRSQPGFVDHPDGFCIDEYALDGDNWTEGFFSP